MADKVKKKNKLFWNLLWEYFSKTNIHGYKYISQKSWIYLERSIWLVVIIFLIALTSYLIISSYIKFLQAPTATTQLPQKVHISNIPFPAAAICVGNRISKTLLHKYATQLFEARNRSTVSIGSSVEEIKKSILLLGGMYDYELNSDELEQLPTVHKYLSDYYGNSTYRTYTVLSNLTPSCDEVLVNCRWQGEIMNCKKLFVARRTYLGLCCTFNVKRLTLTEIAQFRKKQTEIPKPKLLYNKDAGMDKGLSVLVDHNVDNYAYSMFSSITAKLLVYDPREFPDAMSGSLSEIFLNPDIEIFVSIHPELQKGSPQMRVVPPAARGCLFEDELKMKSNDFYSHSECSFVCRMNNMINLCNCYAVYSNLPLNSTFCVVDDLPCLMKWKEAWYNLEPLLNDLNKMKGSFNCPECIPTCDSVKYKIQSSVGQLMYDKLQNRSYWSEFVRNVTDGNYTIAHLYYGSNFATESLQTIVYTWDELLSSFGGICGLVMGASLVSIFELIYYCSGKFLNECIEKRREQRLILTKNQLYWNEFQIPAKNRIRERISH